MGNRKIGQKASVTDAEAERALRIFRREQEMNMEMQKSKGCACPDSDAKTCYFLRYPNQMELDGRDYCECPCHNQYDEDECKDECDCL